MFSTDALKDIRATPTFQLVFSCLSSPNHRERQGLVSVKLTATLSVKQRDPKPGCVYVRIVCKKKYIYTVYLYISHSSCYDAFLVCIPAGKEQRWVWVVLQYCWIKQARVP